MFSRRSFGGLVGLLGAGLGWPRRALAAPASASQDTVTIREWSEVLMLPEPDPMWGGPAEGPVEVRRFALTFPASERPILLIDRLVPQGPFVVMGGPVLISRPRRVIFPTFRESDFESGTFGSFEHRCADTVAAFRKNGFDDAVPGTALAQVTWMTMVVGDEPEAHAIASTHFKFGASDLRFLASLNVIRHELV